MAFLVSVSSYINQSKRLPMLLRNLLGSKTRRKGTAREGTGSLLAPFLCPVCACVCVYGVCVTRRAHRWRGVCVPWHVGGVAWREGVVGVRTRCVWRVFSEVRTPAAREGPTEGRTQARDNTSRAGSGHCVGNTECSEGTARRSELEARRPHCRWTWGAGPGGGGRCRAT